MAENKNPADKAKKDSAKYLKRYEENVEKGMSKAEAMEKAMADDDDVVDPDEVDKALQVVADLVKGNAMDKQLVSQEKADELRKGWTADAEHHVAILSKENFEVRKSLREMTGAHQSGFDSLCKALTAQNEVIRKLVAEVGELKKGGALSAAAASDIKPVAAETPKGVEVLPTQGDAAAAAAKAAEGSKLTAEDFINKSISFLEKNPNAPQALRKGLINANTSLCSGGSLREAVDLYGETLGIKG